MGRKSRRRAKAERRRAKRSGSDSAAHRTLAEVETPEDEAPSVSAPVTATTEEQPHAAAETSPPTPSSSASAPKREREHSSSTLLVEPTPTHPPPVMMAASVPRSMRIALAASVSAAVISAGIALFMVVRDDDQAPRSLMRTASAATVSAEGQDLIEDERDEEDEAAAETSLASAALDAEADAIIDEAAPWPDLVLAELPPVGAAPAEMGQSVGSPRDGALLSPTRLPNGQNYIIRDEDTVWGTANTIEHLRAAIRKVRRKHPGIHRVVIGDISTRRGGPLPGHTSHQSGRDVDIGLVHRGREKDAAPEFIEGTHENLDRGATYDLIAALAATRNDPTGVELIVLDYGLQRILRKNAAARGVPEAQLEALFQFPHGPDSRHGLVRHKPAHRDHLHVRFRCPDGDRYCRSPLIGFAGIEASEPRPEPPPGL